MRLKATCYYQGMSSVTSVKSDLAMKQRNNNVEELCNMQPLLDDSDVAMRLLFYFIFSNVQ